jgi:hypothetical protein
MKKILEISSLKHILSLLAAGALAFVGVFALASTSLLSVSYSETATSTPTPKPMLDIKDYDERLLALAHVATSSPWYTAYLEGTTTASTTTPRPLWPVRRVYPNAGAILPFNRIVAYYGNFYSKGMGVLGQYPEDEVLTKLKHEVAAWEAADPMTPVMPAIEYIDVTAQGSPGKDGTYRLRMPDSQIDHALEMADKVHGIVILDIQVGLSTLQDELPLLTDYLKLPQVHLAIDPEFSMKDGVAPGREIGTMSSSDINYAIQFLANLVKEFNLPPKVLVVHRFTEEMVTGYKKIEPTPEVQVVLNMDGWGFPAKKVNTYNTVIAPEPIQFTGFKLFYKNDTLPPSTGLLTPAEVLHLTPAPIYIQYQ